MRGCCRAIAYKRSVMKGKGKYFAGVLILVSGGSYLAVSGSYIVVTTKIPAAIAISK